MTQKIQTYRFPATDWDEQAVRLIREFLRQTAPGLSAVRDPGGVWPLGIIIWWYEKNAPEDLYAVLNRCAEIRDQVKEQVLSQEFVDEC